jgi:putative ABC transport system substrate-binding protein
VRRREFIVGGAAAAWPLTARAQQPARVPVIGILSSLSPSQISSPTFEEFRRALRDIGYVEGKSINFAYRWADSNQQRLGEFATELADLKVDVVFSAWGIAPAIAARKVTTTIPIVFAGVGDAVGNGLVETLARPGGNATGLVNVSQDVAGKQLEFLKEAVPAISRAGVLWRPSNPGYRNLLGRFDTVIRATGVQVVPVAAESREELVTAFETMKNSQIDGIVVQADDLFISHGALIIELAATNRLPAIYRIGYQAAAGGLMAYGPDYLDMYRRAAAYIDRILKGARPGDLPVEQPTKIELVINLKTAKTLGVAIPLSLIGRADEVIE